jgi:hypothetical protein
MAPADEGKTPMDFKARHVPVRVFLLIAVLGIAVGSEGGSPLGAPLKIDGEPVITVLTKDAIPALDRPEFVSVSEADRDLVDDEPVLGVRRGAVARAYSLWHLNHHEIVNDQVGDLPLAITW